jgi:nucleoside-diphosphate-sugar epimerase
MKILVTGSSGHLGEALVRTLKSQGYEVTGLDILPSPHTSAIGSLTDRSFIRECLGGVETVYHSATLHKPHVGTHSMQQFIDTNITGTLNLLEESLAAGVQCFVYTSTTSVFGDALIPLPGLPAAWITEMVSPIPKNIYGVTKAAAEDLCQLFYRNFGLACVILRTSRFFPEEDDNEEMRAVYEDDNLKANEYLFRRVDLEDVVSANLAAAEKAKKIRFGKYIISATTPFLPADMADLRADAPGVLARLFPGYEREYSHRGWKMFPSIDRVYVNEKARTELGWEPRYDFQSVIDRLKEGRDLRSPIARLVGSKGYHAERFLEGPYPVK